MKLNLKNLDLLTWAPRVLSLGLTLLMYAFLFEFTPSDFSWTNFFLALIPGTMVLVFSVVGWVVPLLGGGLFILLGAGYAVYAWSKVSILAIAVLSGDSILTGVLFIFPQIKSLLSRRKEPEKMEKGEKKMEIPGEKEEKGVDIMAAHEKPSIPAAEEVKKELPPLPETPVAPVLEEKPLVPVTEAPVEEEPKMLEKSPAPEFFPASGEMIEKEMPETAAQPSEFAETGVKSDIPPIVEKLEEPLPPLPEKKEGDLQGSVSSVLDELKPTPQSVTPKAPSWKTSEVGVEEPEEGVDVPEKVTPPPVKLTSTNETAKPGDQVPPTQDVPMGFKEWVEQGK